MARDGFLYTPQTVGRIDVKEYDAYPVIDAATLRSSSRLPPNREHSDRSCHYLVQQYLVSQWYYAQKKTLYIVYFVY